MMAMAIQQISAKGKTMILGVHHTAIATHDIEALARFYIDNFHLEKIVDDVLAANAKSVEEFRAGKDKAFNALVGQVMKASKGKANPAQVNDILKKKLGG